MNGHGKRRLINTFRAWAEVDRNDLGALGFMTEFVVDDLVKKAVLAERKRCAAIAEGAKDPNMTEGEWNQGFHDACDTIAELIMEDRS